MGQFVRTTGQLERTIGHRTGSFSLRDQPYHCDKMKDVGAWRSLVAHLLWEQGVLSSNLSAPTNSAMPPSATTNGLKVYPIPKQ